jgi:5'-3' exonuclease
VYVFDGKPPELKKATLEGRKEKKDEAIDALQAAKVTAHALAALLLLSYLVASAPITHSMARLLPRVNTFLANSGQPYIKIMSYI